GAGCEIAVACDFRIASDKARFGDVWIGIGCVPALGGVFLLPRIVGLAKATELILTGEIIDAREALRIGLVNKVVMPPDLAPAAEQLALQPRPWSPRRHRRRQSRAQPRPLGHLRGRVGGDARPAARLLSYRGLRRGRARPRRAPSPALHCLR